ncbi:hypothetical protein U9M48_009988, partial [Paspalum notatum var. saurae]
RTFPVPHSHSIESDLHGPRRRRTRCTQAFAAAPFASCRRSTTLSPISVPRRRLRAIEMATGSRRKTRNNPTASLTDDLLVEILSRLPVKSLCRFKCVSQHWRAFISHPDHRRSLPQTLAGVFYRTKDRTRFPREARHFSNVSAFRGPPLICPSLSFFPGHERISLILDSCNGLLLCRLRSDSESSPSSQDASFRYLVCNPATESWVVLPDSGCATELRVTRLGFDPSISLDFHVFEFVDNADGYVDGVQIYSCKTAAWSYRESQWNNRTSLFSDDTRSVFLNGFLHLVVVQSGIVAVDVEGQTCWMLPRPDYGVSRWKPGFLGQYQGQLCYINGCHRTTDLSIWVLKDYTLDKWTLKHCVSVEKLCGMVSPSGRRFYHVITVHPQCNLILYVAGLGNMLMAYHIDCEKAWPIGILGSNCQPCYIPYTPFYLDSLTNRHSYIRSESFGFNVDRLGLQMRRRDASRFSRSSTSAEDSGGVATFLTGAAEFLQGAEATLVESDIKPQT